MLIKLKDRPTTLGIYLLLLLIRHEESFIRFFFFDQTLRIICI